MTDKRNSQKLANEGRMAYQRGDYTAAAQAFMSAAEVFTADGDKIAAAEMQNNRSVALLQSGEAKEALQAVRGTDAIFAEAGDIRRQALAIGNQAAALDKLGRLEAAATAYEKSAELLLEVGNNDLRASVLQSLSAVQLRQGCQLEAIATMQAGLEEVKHPSPKQNIVKKLLQIPYKFMNR